MAVSWEAQKNCKRLGSFFEDREELEDVSLTHIH